MDKSWSEMNKEIQALLSKEATLSQAIEKLISFRADMFEQIRQIVMSYPEEAFWQMPFAGVDGYHSKTLAYSIWHIFRIEDIVRRETNWPERRSPRSPKSWISGNCTAMHRKSWSPQTGF